ncbi:MAG: class I SAM-dependent methyltransferase [Firmicutes bacterium]|nr:class I SAM-dependent methyltransferase [Bacillota bacterium]
MIQSNWKDYEIIATGDGEKLERWGDFVLLRPDPQAIWKSQFDLKSFKGLSAHYIRKSDGGGYWNFLKQLPSSWNINYRELTFAVSPTNFKHTGLFPEQAVNWDSLRDICQKSAGINNLPLKVLNLFAYTGGASVALAKEGVSVTHLDAAKGMIERAKNNAELSKISSDKIRYIADDATKFVGREIKRGNKYDGILMDPPSYGRGPGGELWKLEDNLFDLVKLCKNILSDNPRFFLINSYTTGLQPSVLKNILNIVLGDLKGQTSGYELILPTNEKGIVLPAGCSGLWRNN